MATLEELQLGIGQVLQLQLTRLDQGRVYGKLVGYVVGQAVIVTLAESGDNPWPVRESDPVICRGFAEGIAFGFQSEVLKVAQQPFRHLHLVYPRQVESVVVRKNSRVTLSRQAALLKNTEQGEVKEAGTMIDISASGTCVIAKPGMAEVNDTLTLLVPADKSEEAELRLSVAVRSARLSDAGAGAGKEASCQYGMEFVDLTVEQTRGIEKLMMDQVGRSIGHGAG